jgi:hypothetical protein
VQGRPPHPPSLPNTLVRQYTAPKGSVVCKNPPSKPSVTDWWGGAEFKGEPHATKQRQQEQHLVHTTAATATPMEANATNFNNAIFKQDVAAVPRTKHWEPAGYLFVPLTRAAVVLLKVQTCAHCVKQQCAYDGKWQSAHCSSLGTRHPADDEGRVGARDRLE